MQSNKTNADRSMTNVPQKVQRRGREYTEFCGVRLTKQQAELVRWSVDGYPVDYAMRKANYTFNGGSYPAHILHNPRVQLAIQRGLHARVRTEGAPQAYRVAQDMMLDKATPPGIRWKISQWMLETTGIQPAQQLDQGGERPLEDLSLAELEAIAQEARRRLDALPVINGETVAPSAAPEQQTEQQNSGIEEGETAESLEPCGFELLE